MSRLPMSRAAAALLRALLNRCGEQRDRILLIDYHSTDWQSLVFVGERHRFELRFTGPDAGRLIDSVSSGLGEAEFSIPGQILADITVEDAPRPAADGSLSLVVEALTIAE
jgi:hypothetical protein